jgi:dTDP-6-deoxy-L-talose 4-dehydrogenase (NAD+)
LALKRADSGVVNLCSGQPISVRKLVEGWIKDNDWSIELNLGHYPYPDYEPMAFWGDRRKLDSLLETR